MDGAKGVETQTRKLDGKYVVCVTLLLLFSSTRWTVKQKIRSNLLDELEEELVINVRPLTWPIESGPRFKGVYNIYEQKLNLFQPSKAGSD